MTLKCKACGGDMPMSEIPDSGGCLEFVCAHCQRLANNARDTITDRRWGGFWLERNQDEPTDRSP